MDKLSLIEKQISIIGKLSKGIDPTTDICFEEDTILNHPAIKDVFNDVGESLKEYLQILLEFEKQSKNKVRKINFYLSKERALEINISDIPITISKLAFLINEALNDSSIKKIKATQLTDWLEANEYLETVYDEYDNPRKIPTPKGKSIGIISNDKKNSIGKIYSANLYDKHAQKFVIEVVVKEFR